MQIILIDEKTLQRHVTEFVAIPVGTFTCQKIAGNRALIVVSTNGNEVVYRKS